ncbi:peptide chain release factor aRF-1 [uncultured Methanobrevibacter sp.]|uniref:peptide chain release factor aRF-1 n=1 Tax=uncultured Methanobrevibacter sp. TaxID=253161 RepID=UPI0025EFAF72|nr:peptide chain release factor aRF-1 [uncultured Methanobrevibacter sp.]
MSEVSSKELYEFKKTLKELSQKRGRGTELVSVYIPPDKQLSDVGKHMRDELGQSANIKSKQTKKNVQSAIEVILQSIRLYKQPPENGLVLFVGMIPKGGPGTEKMEKYILEPPEPIVTYWYKCNNEFFLEPLEYMIEERDTYGLAVVDRKEATIATLKGKKINIVSHLTSGVPGKHKAGGQSQRRFDRVIEDEAREFLKRIAKRINDEFLPLKDDLKAVVIGGPGFTKNDLVDADYIQYEIKDKIIATVDTSYTGEFGIREVINKSTDLLNELDVIHEKEIIQKFLGELRKDNGLYSYGEEEVRNNLIIGAVDTLLLSEDLSSMRKTFKCGSCGYETGITVKDQSEADAIEERCPECNEMLKEESSDFVDMAEEMNSNVEFISTETEEGMQLYRAFGGIGAILRYYVGH